MRLQSADVDIASEGWNRLALSIVGNDLGDSPITGSVPAQDGLCRPVPGSSHRSWAAVTTVACLSKVSLTGGVGFPGAVNGAQ